jgi:hypothetical protein
MDSDARTQYRGNIVGVVMEQARPYPPPHCGCSHRNSRYCHQGIEAGASDIALIQLQGDVHETG